MTACGLFCCGVRAVALDCVNLMLVGWAGNLGYVVRFVYCTFALAFYSVVSCGLTFWLSCLLILIDMLRVLLLGFDGWFVCLAVLGFGVLCLMLVYGASGVYVG